MEKKPSSVLVKGLIIALILIIVDVISNFTGYKYETWFRWIPSILMCLCFIIACIYYGNEMNHNVTFGNVFGHGFKISLVLACIFVIYTLLSVYVIFPEQKEKLLEMQMKELDKNPNITESVKDTSITMFNKMFLPIALIAAVIGTIIVGVIGSLLGAAFTKKNPTSPFQQQTI